MRAALIGSRAYKETDYGDVDILCDREWKDAWDRTYGGLGEPRTDGRYASDTSKYETCEGIYEVIVPSVGSAHETLLHASDEWEPVGGSTPGFDFLPGTLVLRRTPLVFLAALKKAHLILPSSSPEKWRRQMEEYVALKKALYALALDRADRGEGDVLREGLFIEDCWSPTRFAKGIFGLHRTECLARQQKPPVLAQGKASFFGAESYEVFDHDSIHRALARPREPAYVQMKDGEVMCSRSKWAYMPEEEKLRCVVEEASILALERSILPHLFLDKGYRGERWAYEHALMKICTTITSGFFRDYCIEAWPRAVEAKPPLAELFFAGLKDGIVKRKGG